MIGSAAAPISSTSFIGREQELVEVGGLLESVRLVTLTGPPGVGKTRLARELAGRHGGDAALVDLAPIREPRRLDRTLAAALSVQEVPGQSPMRSVIARLRRRRLLLVLDNCEHLLGAACEAAERLIEGCPELTVVATSRERFDAEGEWVWPVRPLAVPESGAPAEPEMLLRYSAVRLFVERVGAVQPGFTLNSYVAPAVGDICRRLDGIPLAIELAARRVDMLTPAEIARRLDARFDLLTGSGVDGGAHHLTLAAALDWSHELLSCAERALLRRLSVFIGGFDPEAAPQVCAGGPVAPGAVAGLLEALVSKSLVAAEPSAGGRVRYRLLESIAAYASDRLEHADEAATLRERHARFYAALAEELEPRLTGPEQVDVIGRLDSERGNLRRALEWSLGHGQGPLALRQAGALVLYWRVRCHFSEGRELLDAALAGGGGDELPLLRAKALWGAGFMTLMGGNPEAAVASLEESLAIFRDQDDSQGVARALLVLANCDASLTNVRAVPLLGESATLARESGDAWCLAHALGLAGFERAGFGELPAARVLFEECLEVGRTAGDHQSQRLGLLGLASVVRCQGRYDSAESLLDEALDVACELDEPYAKVRALYELAELALARGDFSAAEDLLAQASVWKAEADPTNSDLGHLVLLARVSHAIGNRARAREILEQALDQAGTRPPILALRWKGDLALEEGDLDSAEQLMESALGRAKLFRHKVVIAEALHGRGLVARARGEVTKAAMSHAEAMALQREADAAPAIVASLEALAGLAAVSGHLHRAARLLGATSARRETNRYARLPWESAAFEADLAIIRGRLGRAEFDIAVRGAHRLSLDEAAALALEYHDQLAQPVSGWASLTKTERQVAVLVAEGLMNAQIGERLLISVGTVKRHMTHILSKLGVRRRTEVARAVWRHEQRRVTIDTQANAWSPLNTHNGAARSRVYPKDET